MKKKDSSTGRKIGFVVKARYILPAVLLLAVAIANGFQGGRSNTIPTRSSPFQADRAFADLKVIVGFGPRPAGSESLAKTRAYIVAELKKAGLNPQLDEFEAMTPRGRRRMTN